MFIYQSNRLEQLFALLLEVRSHHTPPPLMAEMIVVQSQGVARWLSRQIAGNDNICANIAFPFPAALIGRLLHSLAETDQDLYSKDILIWVILDLFDDILDKDSFQPLKNYLSTSDTPSKRYQLATRIAATFDQYLLYRPDWITEWEEGKGESWQAILWQKIQARLPGRHRSALLSSLRANLDHDCLRQAGLPDILYVFGISTMPKTYFDIFAALAAVCDIHFFLLNPCELFWDDIVSPSRAATLSTVDRHPAVIAEDLHYDTGNILLANNGQQLQDFLRLLHNTDVDSTDFFVDPGNRTRLAAIQQDILQCRPPSRTEQSCPQHDDQSIMFHVVHSPMREIEVLHDQLLALFDRHPDLSPEDILVMTPDITTYAPYIEAVFSAPTEEGHHIPYSIADRRLTDGSPTLRAFFELLDLPGSRMEASRVLAFLELEMVRSRFHISDTDISLIRHWVSTLPIHWGFDMATVHMTGLHQPAKTNWQQGLDRLFLGFALPGNNRHLFAELLPYDDIEGDMFQVLGQLAQFQHQLGLFIHNLQPRTPAAWQQLLSNAIAGFFVAGPANETDISLLYQGLHHLVRSAEKASFARPIPLETVITFLEDYCRSQASAAGFLSGRVTFCQMVPMRSVPSRVICLLGLQDGNFPRQDFSPSFDLMSQDHRLGDRCRRDDDRAMFLESILSAREYLYISYIGRSIGDNSVIPPAVPVAELLDYLAAMADADIPETLLCHHPLQSFSPRYFSGETLFSYSRTNYLIASRLEEERTFTGIYDQDLPLDEEVLDISFPDFIRFFENPVRYFLQQRLGVFLHEKATPIADREKFSLNRLEAYQIRQQLITAALNGENPADLFEIVQPAQLPAGTTGRLWFAPLAEEAARFSCRIQELRQTKKRHRVELSHRIGQVTLSGSVDLFDDEIHQFRPVSLQNCNFRDIMDHWLWYILTAVSLPEVKAIFIAEDEISWYETIPSPKNILNDLVEIYCRGMIRPLPIFPKTTMAYGKKLWQGKGGSPEEALFEAHKIWQEKSLFAGPEREDPYMYFTFGDSNPLQEDNFQTLAAAILRPALEFRRTQ